MEWQYVEKAVAYVGGGALGLWLAYVVVFMLASAWTTGKLQSEERHQKNIFQKALGKIKEKQ